MTEPDGRKGAWSNWRARRKTDAAKTEPKVTVIDLPLSGIEQKEAEVDPSYKYPFIVVGLTDTADFSAETYGEMFDRNLEWDRTHGVRNPYGQKYIVIQQEHKGERTDGLFVFPRTIQHDAFFNRLQILGYTGELQSAGLVSKDVRFSDYSPSLLDKGLTREQSDRYQQGVLANKFKKEG